MRCTLVLMLVACACGGEVSGDGNDASADASNWSPVCPATRPANGASCSQDGLDCEYGCSDVLECSGGNWSGAILIGGDGFCEDAGPNPSTCPNAFSAITQGSPCTNPGATCAFSEGICQCNSPADPTPDGGDTWFCGPEQGCPMPRPRIGSACAVPNQRCDYEICGDDLSCTNGVWQPAIGVCGG